MNKMGEHFIDNLKQINVADLQEFYENNHQRRNLKLFKTYNNQWKEHEEKAIGKLSQGMDKRRTKEMKEKRISVMNHDKKVREKVELAQVKDIL